MLKTILTTGFLLFFIHVSFSQAVSKSTFDEAIDYINCKVTELSLSDQEGRPNFNAYQGYFPNCAMSTDFPTSFYHSLKDFLSKASLKKNIDLAVTINSYKNKYREGMLKEEAFSVLTTDIFTHSELINFKEKSKRSQTFPRMMQRVKEETAARLGMISNNRDVADDGISVEDINSNATEEAENEDLTSIATGSGEEDYRHLPSSDSGELSFKETHDDMHGQKAVNEETVEGGKEVGMSKKVRNILLILLLLGALGYFVFQKRLFAFDGSDVPFLSRNGSPVNPEEVTNLKGELQSLKKHSDSLQSELDYLRLRVNKLEHRSKKVPPPLMNQPSTNRKPIENLPPEVLNPTPKYDKPIEPIVPPISTRKPIDVLPSEVLHPTPKYDNPIEVELDTPSTSAAPIIGKSLYLPFPNPDSTFDDATALLVFKRPTSIYHFTIVSEDGNLAEFEVYNDIATMIRALEDPDRYLKPACRSNSIIHISATKIITNERGIAEQSNGQWRVTKKAVVHYV